MVSDTDKIVAAILTAGRCSNMPDARTEMYVEVYAKTLELLANQQKKPPMKISAEVLETIGRR